MQSVHQNLSCSGHCGTLLLLTQHPLAVEKQGLTCPTGDYHPLDARAALTAAAACCIPSVQRELTTSQLLLLLLGLLLHIQHLT
jgi:hypothetical protein